MKKIYGAAKMSHIQKILWNIYNRMKSGKCSVAKAIALEVNRSPYVSYGEIETAWNANVNVFFNQWLSEGNG